MSAHAEQSNGTQHATPAPPLPAVAAIFLVKFDDRKGYTVAWQKCIDGLTIDNGVEFKCLPSGLHNVEEDLVYFIYEDYAGISASLNAKDEEAARKARVIAVGVLVPLEHGRMGKSWLHADNLKELARHQIANVDDVTELEKYWEEHKLSTSPQSEELTDSPGKTGLNIDTGVNDKSTGYQISRSMTTGTMHPASYHTLPNHHPALFLSDLLRLFGPLIFPLVRAAMLRKRILILGEAPVEKACSYVYNISVLSSLPRPIAAILPLTDPQNLRSKPLFNVGIADIPLLESLVQSSSGWIACTTDDVLCTKPNLFDMLVILPNTAKLSNDPQAYPRLYLSSDELTRAYPKHGIRASQRDAKRFVTLWKGLQRIPRSMKEQQDMSTSAVISSDENSPEDEEDNGIADSASVNSTVSSTPSLKSVIEPQSWSRIAYTSLIWWASAGDKRAGLTEVEENEDEQDVALLTGEGLGEEDDGLDEPKTREVACVAYFHRLTNMLFTAMEEVIQRTDGYEERYRDEEQDEDSSLVAQRDQGDTEHSQALLQDRTRNNKSDADPTVEITHDDIQSMGLDVWSSSDRKFVEELAAFWWGRKAVVQSGRIECCGVRIL